MLQSSITRWHFIAAFLICGFVAAAFGFFIYSFVNHETDQIFELPPLPPRAAETLQFWLGSDDGNISLTDDRVKLWDAPNEPQIEIIRSRFAHDIKLAQNKELDSWNHHPRGRLALILILDRFPNILFENKKESFTHDAQALDVALDGIKLHQDVELTLVERVFFYRPLLEVESLEVQNRAVALYDRLYQAALPHEKTFFEHWLTFAQARRDLIYEFGRFPERNAILNRESTAQELEYLNTPKTVP